MAQFYFLSILLNFCEALVLMYGKDFLHDSSEEKVSKVLSTSSKKNGASKSTSSKAKKTDSNEAKNNVKEEAVLKAKKVDEKAKKFLSDFAFLDSKNFRLVIGILSAFVGLMLLLSPFKGDIAVIGDLIPVLACLSSAASIILEYYMTSSKGNIELNPTVKKIFLDSRRWIGLLCIFAAVLHFIFPGVILL